MSDAAKDKTPVDFNTLIADLGLARYGKPPAPQRAKKPPAPVTGTAEAGPEVQEPAAAVQAAPEATASQGERLPAPVTGTAETGPAVQEPAAAVQAAPEATASQGERLPVSVTGTAEAGPEVQEPAAAVQAAPEATASQGERLPVSVTGTAEAGPEVQEPAAVQAAPEATASQGERLPAPQAPPSSLPGGFAPLWTVADVASFLQRSERWVFNALTQDPAKPGSLPFIRIPGGRGSHGQGSPRFVPAEVVSWVSEGCPPVTVFRSWQGTQRKSKRKAS